MILILIGLLHFEDRLEEEDIIGGLTVNHVGFLDYK